MGRSGEKEDKDTRKVIIVGTDTTSAALRITESLPSGSLQLVTAEQDLYYKLKSSALSLMALMEGMVPGALSSIRIPKVKQEHDRHQGDKERARRQKQKDRAEAKAIRSKRGKL